MRIKNIALCSKKQKRVLCRIFFMNHLEPNNLQDYIKDFMQKYFDNFARGM